MVAKASRSIPMGWFKVIDGRVVYSGRITREPYMQWTTTAAGAASLAERAKTVGFRLFGRTRAARKQIWRELDDASRSAEGRDAMQAAADLYLRMLSTLAYAQGLPRVTAALRRVVLVPRALAAGRARADVHARLAQCRGFGEAPPALQQFLFERALLEVDAAARLARPSIDRPVDSSPEWILVASDTAVQWVDQIWSGAGWTGHWFLYERPRTPPTRSERKEIERAMASLRASVASIPRERRQALVKLAAG
jgi:hypothetical protein